MTAIRLTSIVVPLIFFLSFSPVAEAGNDPRFGVATARAQGDEIGNYECTLGQILLFAGKSANGMVADGRLLDISKYGALYSLVGTTFGSEANSFAIPDLRGVTPNGLTATICSNGYYPYSEGINYQHMPLPYTDPTMIDTRFGEDTQGTYYSHPGYCSMGQLILSASQIQIGSLAQGSYWDTYKYSALFALLSYYYNQFSFYVYNTYSLYALPDLRLAAPNGLNYSVCDWGIFPFKAEPQPTAAHYSGNNDPAVYDSRFGNDTGWAYNGQQDMCTLGEVTLVSGSVSNAIRAEGQVLKISEYPDLFTQLGTMYGGDGVSTFALPDLRNVAPNHTTYSICTRGDPVGLYH